MLEQPFVYSRRFAGRSLGHSFALYRLLFFSGLDAHDRFRDLFSIAKGNPPAPKKQQPPFYSKIVLIFYNTPIPPQLLLCGGSFWQIIFCTAKKISFLLINNLVPKVCFFATGFSLFVFKIPFLQTFIISKIQTQRYKSKAARRRTVL